jgi:hypothetical protein
MSNFILLVRPEPNHLIDYPVDVAMLKAALNGAGYDASDRDIVTAWEEYSDSMCASWMSLAFLAAPDLVMILLRHLTPAIPSPPATGSHS